jgi:hypothetical protein
LIEPDCLPGHPTVHFALAAAIPLHFFGAGLALAAKTAIFFPDAEENEMAATPEAKQSSSESRKPADRDIDAIGALLLWPSAYAV